MVDAKLLRDLALKITAPRMAEVFKTPGPRLNDGTAVKRLSGMVMGTITPAEAVAEPERVESPVAIEAQEEADDRDSEHADE
jgi:hypothetical protein